MTTETLLRHPPAGRDPYAWQFERSAAELFLTYCASTALARAADPALQQVAIPASLSVAADCGLILLDRPEAARLALFILTPAGQADACPARLRRRGW